MTFKSDVESYLNSTSQENSIHWIYLDSLGVPSVGNGVALAWQSKKCIGPKFTSAVKEGRCVQLQ